MTSKYKPHWSHEAEPDPAYCAASVHSGFGAGFSQCSRKAKIDGWCKQHHPDAEAARRRKQTEKYDRETAVFVYRAAQRGAYAKIKAAYDKTVEQGFDAQAFACAVALIIDKVEAQKPAGDKE